MSTPPHDPPVVLLHGWPVTQLHWRHVLPFLRPQSAGPSALDSGTIRSYIEAYSAPSVLKAGLGYYRTRRDDITDVNRLLANPIATPVLAIGGRYAMSTAVGDGIRALAHDVTGTVLDRSGHYPVEQEPELVADVIIEFLHRHHGEPAANEARTR